MQLTVDQAVKMALDNNVDLATERLDPQISDTQVAAAEGAYRPVFSSSLQRNNQLQPPSSFLIPTSTRTDAVTSDVSLRQRVGRFGTSYSVAWDTTHTDSNSVLNSYNPLLQSGLSLNLSQPLVRDLSIDSPRVQLALSQTDRAVAETRLRETLVHTTASVKSAYWNLVSAMANVDARKSALDLAQELERVNKVKVDVGQSPPLDLVSAQAEVAADQEQLIVAETAVKQTEDRLRVLIFDPTDRDNWNIKIDPVDAPPTERTTINLDEATTRALRDRADLERARKNTEAASTNLKLAANQRLPDVRLNAAYVASGLGGTQVLRAGGFPGTVVGPGNVTSFATVLGQLFGRDYPTWTVGISVSYPIGQSTEAANYARTALERKQAEQRVKSAEGNAIQQVRNAAWNIEMDAKRIETTHAARDLAEQRLDAERKRFEVGLSTSFLVIQAQRDLAQAKTNELAAVLAYDLALVDFEVLQEAGPADQAQAAPAAGSSGTPVTAGTTAAPSSSTTTTTTTIGGLRF
jgi:outer membrane protein TolC